MKVPESTCTGCGEKLDGATCLDKEKTPKSGDVMICIYCGHIMIYDKKQKLRNPTNDEIRLIAGDPDILRAQRAIALAKRILNDH